MTKVVSELTRGEPVPYTCSECESKNIIQDDGSGEIICGSCGLVLSESIINKGPEWSAFTPSETESRSRVGLPISFSMHDKGLSTIIRVDRDAHGKRLPPKTRHKMFRLRRWQELSKFYASANSNLAQAMTELDGLSDRLHLPPTIQETAAVIYRKALKKGLIRGRPISPIAAASLYAACRLTQTPRTLREFALQSLSDKKVIARCYRLLLRELDLRMPVPKAKLRVPRIASKLGVGEKTQRRAVEILDEAKRLKVTSGKSPMGLAAAALYIACLENGETRTQTLMADASGVTEVTIRNLYTELTEVLGLEGIR